MVIFQWEGTDVGRLRGARATVGRFSGAGAQESARKERTRQTPMDLTVPL